jgi:hypothetical protein
MVQNRYSGLRFKRGKITQAKACGYRAGAQARPASKMQ